MERPHFPDVASLGLRQCQVSEGRLCVQRDSRSGFLWGGRLGLQWASSQGPALPLPPPPKLSAPIPPPRGQQARMMLGAPSPPRGQGPGRWPGRDRSSCQAPCGIR